MENLSVGNRIALIRIHRGYSQSELGKKIGYTAQGISSLEVGNSIPDIYFCFKLAEVLNIPVEDVFGIEKEERQFKFDYDNLAYNLVAIRKENNLKQKEVAEMFGLCSNTLSSYEHGKTVPDAEFILRFMRTFKVGLYDLFKPIPKNRIHIRSIIMFSIAFILFFGIGGIAITVGAIDGANARKLYEDIQSGVVIPSTPKQNEAFKDGFTNGFLISNSTDYRVFEGKAFSVSLKTTPYDFLETHPEYTVKLDLARSGIYYDEATYAEDNIHGVYTFTATGKEFDGNEFVLYWSLVKDGKEVHSAFTEGFTYMK